jgi:hypothetical protein
MMLRNGSAMASNLIRPAAVAKVKIGTAERSWYHPPAPLIARRGLVTPPNPVTWAESELGLI